MLTWDDYIRVAESAAMTIPPHEDKALLPERPNVRISDLAAVVRADGEGRAKLHEMRWSFPPMRPGAGPVFNFRSEGRTFRAEQRCLIPASAFFEFTAPADPKQKRKDRWRFTRADGDWLAIAGIWKPSQGNQPPVFTLLTCEPGPDVAQLHNRQVVVLETGDWKGWLLGAAAEAQVLKPTPAGTFVAAPG